MAAQAAAPESITPSSHAGDRINSASRSIGHAASGPATSTKSIRPRRSSRRISAISRVHSGHPPSNQAVSWDMSVLLARQRSRIREEYLGL
jgi:hypothetical protein